MAKKPGMKEFRAAFTADTAPAPAAEESVTAVDKERNTASAILSPGFQIPKASQRKFLRLPVTGTEIELSGKEIAPNECVIHPRNRRIQSLLSPSNPKVRKLVESFKTEGQREPVLARYIKGKDGNLVVEIIDGSRRRYAAELLSKENTDFKLRIWVASSVPDVDADFLTRSENENRDDISPWETAHYIARLADENPSWSQEVLADKEGIDQSMVSLYLTLAHLPVSFVRLVESPDLVTLTGGVELVKVIRALSDDEQQKLLTRLSGKAPFGKFRDYVKTVKELLKKPAPVKKPTANSAVPIEVNGKVRAEVSKHRTKKGQYKVELYDLSDSNYQKLMDALPSLLS